MSFLNVWALSIAAAVLPALLLLYFLKLRRREQPISSTLLWKRAVQDLQVNAPFQRLRKNLLLLLQLLVLMAAIFALARPIVRSDVASERSLVILIDRSASMNTLEEGRSTRLDLAKQQADRLIRTLNRTGGGWLDVSSWFSFGAARPQTRAMVIAFSDRASVIAPFTTNVDELTSLVRGIEPTDGRTNLAEALELAAAYMLPTMAGELMNNPVSPEAESKLILISDGAVADLDSAALRTGSMEFIRIGAAQDNVGVTALRTQRNYERPERVDVFVQVHNFGPEPVTTDVSLYVDGVLETSRGAVQSITLGAASPLAAAVPEAESDPPAAPPPSGPGAAAAATAAQADDDSASTASLSYELVLDRAALLEVRLSRPDRLDRDDRAATLIPPPRRLRVLCVRPPNSLIPFSLRGLPLAERVFMTPAEYESAAVERVESAGRSTFDVVIFCDHTTARLPTGNYLFLGGAPQVEGVEIGDALDPFALTWWDDTSPILRNVRLEQVLVRTGRKLQFPESASLLIEGPGGPVLARWTRGGSQYLVLNFAVEASTWWRERTFPIFVYNALQFLGSAAGTADATVLRPGDAVRIAVPPPARTARVRLPDGSTTTVTANDAGEAHFGGTQRVGVYSVEPAAEGRDRFAVNLEDEWESDIRPRGGLTVGGTEVVERSGIRTDTPEIWRWFIGAALLIVFLEWYIYNRRVMV
ncbi:MAG: VWA domain-containing protein [Phycisphaerales bacterium]|nr:VWA domain-containing protein [Phycisphaerales bacterium]